MELLAKYGTPDPEKFHIPIPMISDVSADLSFSGIQTSIKSQVSLRNFSATIASSTIL